MFTSNSLRHARRTLAPRRTGVRLRRSVVGSLHLGHFRTGTQKMSFWEDRVFR